MKTKWYLIGSFMVICNMNIFAFKQDSCILDLGLYKPGTIKIFDGNCKYQKIIIESLVAGFDYDIKVKSKVQMLSPLELFKPDDDKKTKPTPIITFDNQK